MITTSPTALSWRLDHDGTTVFSLQHCTGRTQTIRTLFVAETKAEVAAEIARLNLTVPAAIAAILAPTIREQIIALFGTLPGELQAKYLPAFEALQPALRSGDTATVRTGLLNITVTEPAAAAVRVAMLDLLQPS